MSLFSFCSVFVWLVLLAVLVCTRVQSSLDSLCPVSRNVAYSEHNFNYPLEAYRPNVHSQPNVTCIMERRHKMPVSCPLMGGFCPLIEDNFEDAVKNSTTWPKLTSLCSLKEVFNDINGRSRIIILGGSVVTGMDAIGCCDLPECFEQHCRRCAWSTHLNNWLHATMKANVTVHNMAMPGTDSIFAAEVAYSMMTEIGVSYLTSSDVIIIDYSFNDNAKSYPIEDERLKRGLEKLIRFFLGLAASRNNMPHIILMEVDVEPAGPPANYYRHVYHQLAAYYGLHLFSYADMVLSSNSITKQAVYHSHLTHEYRREKHAPWHGHLIYADFVAGMLLRQMNCTQSAFPHSSTGEVGHYTLPPAISKLDDSYMCKAGVPPLVKMSYNDIMENKSIGSFYVPRNDTWELTLDRKKRGGFIMRIKDQYPWSYLHNAPLVLPLGITVGQFRNMSLMLQLQFMRSYADAGNMVLCLCDACFRDLDCLWRDYKHYRHTLQDVYSVHLVEDICNGQHFGKPDQPWTDDEMVELSIRYLVHSQAEENNNMTRLIEGVPRGIQLVKINSVLVCHQNV